MKEIFYIYTVLMKANVLIYWKKNLKLIYLSI